MKRNPKLPTRSLTALLFGLLLSLSTPVVLAQTDTDEDDDDIILLDPFIISTERDRGFYKSQTATAARLAIDVIDAPMSISVVGEDFIQATGAENLQETLKYVPGVATNPDDIIRNTGIVLRGFAADFTLRDGFKKYYTAAIDGIDRVEIVKGAVSAFYGRSEPGGVINYITKRPRFQWNQELSLSIGTDDHYRALVDSEGIIWKDGDDPRLAYRVVSSYTNEGSWKDFVEWERTYFLGMLSFKPIQQLDIFLSYEYFDSKRNGGVNSALIYNEDYYAEYEQWQAIAEQQNWQLRVINSDIAGTDGPWNTNYFPYNIEKSTRYPLNYSGLASEFSSTATYERFIGNNPWFGDAASSPWVGNQYSFADPRTGSPQQPIIGLSSDSGVRVDGQFRGNTRPLAGIEEARQYRAGWRTIQYFETGVEAPIATGNFYPLGFEWNPNGPGSWNNDLHHLAVAEIVFTPFTWLNMRYSANYTENSSQRFQQFNSDLDQDGYTLNMGQGFPGAGTLGGAQDQQFQNDSWIHQFDMNISFETGPVKHRFTFNAAYFDDYFRSFAFTTNETFRDDIGGQNSPGFALIDIFNEPLSSVNDWRSEDRRFIGGTHHQEQGYGAVYQGDFFDEKLLLLAGIRHERRDTDTLSELFDPDTGERTGYQANESSAYSDTTPMIGALYTLFKTENNSVVRLYASYSESFQPPNRGNTPYVDPASARAAAELEDWGATLDFVDPEPITNVKGRGYEFGFKADTETISGSLTYFHVEKVGVIVADSVLTGRLSNEYDLILIDYEDEIEAARDAGNPNIEAYLASLAIPNAARNAGVETSEGIELELYWTPNIKGFSEDDNYQLKLGISYLFEASVAEDQILDFGDPTLAPGMGNNAPIANPSLFIEDYHVLWAQETDRRGRPIGNAVVTTPIGEPTPTDGTAPLDADTAVSWDQRVPTGRGLRPKTEWELSRPDLFGEVYYLPLRYEWKALVPRTQIQVFQQYRFTDGRLDGLRVGLGAVYESSVHSFQSVYRPYRNDSILRWDAVIGYEWEWEGVGDFDFRLNITNLFDGEFERGSFGVYPTRQFRFTVKCTF